MDIVERILEQNLGELFYQLNLNTKKSVIYSHNTYAYIHIYIYVQDTYWRNE